MNVFLVDSFVFLLYFTARGGVLEDLSVRSVLKLNYMNGLFPHSVNIRHTSTGLKSDSRSDYLEASV